MLIENFEHARSTKALEIVGRRISMEMHGKQLALNEIRLRRLAQADRHIRLAHRKVQFLVAGDQREAHFGIEVDELAEPRREPMHADARLVVTSSSPFGFSRLSESFARAASSFMKTSCAVR